MIGRATLFTSTSALLAGALLGGLRIASPRIHRTAWLLVVVQGWLVVPWVWQIETTAVEGPHVSVRMAPAPAKTVESTSTISALPDVQTPAPLEGYLRLLSAVWLLGMAFMVLSRLLRYARFLSKASHDKAETDALWQRDWQRQLRATHLRSKVDLCVTRELGPLVCFTPFQYLVMVPQSLWTRLTRRARSIILRHELAHLVRGDLWWSLAIRLLALPLWFNPLVWHAARRFDEAGEWACDDWVSSRGRGRNLLFASSLLATAEYATAATPGTLAMQGGEFSRRIRRLVSRRFKEETMAKKLLVLLPLMAIAAVQLVRIKYVEAAPNNIAGEERSRDSIDDSVKSTDKPLGYGNVPYIIESHDVLSIGQVTMIAIRQFEKKDLLTDRLLVWPDGRVNLGSFGSVYVSGMTVNQAQVAIKKQLLAAKKFNDVKFDLHVDSVNSKKVCVILHIRQGDYVQDIVCPPGTTVSKVVDSFVWPQPVDLKAAKIWVARPAPRGIGLEQIRPVNWDDVLQEKPLATNYELHPCNRLFISTVKERGEPSKPPGKPEFPAAKSLYAPPAATELRSASAAPPKVSAQIEFEIDMIEDRANNLAEFDAKRGDACFAVFDSDTIRPALRILAKHELIKKLSSPKLTCLVGQTATLETIADDQGKSPADSLKLHVFAGQFDGGLMVQLGLKTTRHEKHYDFDSSIPVKPGQSVLVRANVIGDWQSPVQDAGPLYVVLTPSIVLEAPLRSGGSSYYQYLEPPTAE